MARRQAQPRIKGITRDPAYTRLHPAVKAGIRTISRMEGRSISWVMAECISMFFEIDAATGKPQTREDRVQISRTWQKRPNIRLVKAS